MTKPGQVRVDTVFGAAAEGRQQVPVEATFLAAAPCNAPLPEEYLRAQDLNEDAWREAMQTGLWAPSGRQP